MGRARRCDPAPLCFKGEPSGTLCATVPSDREWEGLPQGGGVRRPAWTVTCRNLRGLRVRPDLEDKKGTSPDRFISVRGFFWIRP